MRWPADRTLTDAQRKIVDSWLGGLKILEPMLKWTPEDFATALTVIRAAQSAQEEDDPFSLSAAIAALPIDEEPDTAEDYVVGYDVSEARAERFPISSLSGSHVLISTTEMAGSASVDISIPAGYTDVELRVRGLSTSGGDEILIAFSENGGTTLLTQEVDIFRNGASQTGSVAGLGAWQIIGNGSGETSAGRMKIFDYTSGTNKIVNEWGIRDDVPTAWTGSRILTSTTPINAVRYEPVAGSFDAGTVELWGVP